MKPHDKITPLPFFAGQKVKVSDYGKRIGTRFDHNTVHVISECVSKINPANGKGPFVYVGIVGYCNGQSWFNPELFEPCEELKASIMTFEQIKESNPYEILMNN